MSKISLYSSVLVDKYGLKPSEANEFVETLFSVIREKLEEEKIVKVKGLGTFKLAEMNARESVNVNTGERITIEGRYKLSFTPENALRDRINAPFSQFESIDIDNDVDFSEIDKKYEYTNDEQNPESVTADDVAAESFLPEQPAASEKIEQSVVPVAPVEPVDPAPVESAIPSTATPSVAVTEEPDVEETAVEEPVTIEPDEAQVEEKTPEETSAEAELQKQQPASADGELETVRSPFCENLIREELEHSHRIIKLLKTIIYLILILLVCIGGYFAYHLWNTQKPTSVCNEPQEEIVAPHDTIAEADTLTNDSTIAAEQADTLKAAPAEPEKPAVDPQEDIYNKDARVRTGAYRIVGIDTTVTVQKGQTFKGITKAYLGEGMECYVEAVNDGKTEVMAGEKLNIPKLELKKRKRK